MISYRIGSEKQVISSYGYWLKIGAYPSTKIPIADSSFKSFTSKKAKFCWFQFLKCDHFI